MILLLQNLSWDYYIYILERLETNKDALTEGKEWSKKPQQQASDQAKEYIRNHHYLY